MTKVVEDDRAKQGGTGRPVLYVLVGGLLLAGIYLAAMVGWSGSESPADPGQTKSQQTSNPGPASSNSGNVPAGNPAYPAPAAPPAGTTGSAPTSR
jgi:hypothetical protein